MGHAPEAYAVVEAHVDVSPVAGVVNAPGSDGKSYDEENSEPSRQGRTAVISAQWSGGLRARWLSENRFHAIPHYRQMIVVVAALVALFGGAIGSFAGVVASRGLRESLRGRSRCDSCGRTLRWYELIPLVSYPALRGRCRTCRAHVGIGVYAWEIGGAVLVLAVALPIALALGVPAR